MSIRNLLLLAGIGLIIGCLIVLAGCATGIVRVKGNGDWSFYGFQFCQEFMLPKLNVSSNGMFTIYGLKANPDGETAGKIAEGTVRGLK